MCVKEFYELPSNVPQQQELLFVWKRSSPGNTLDSLYAKPVALTMTLECGDYCCPFPGEEAKSCSARITQGHLIGGGAGVPNPWLLPCSPNIEYYICKGLLR